MLIVSVLRQCSSDPPSPFFSTFYLPGQGQAPFGDKASPDADAHSGARTPEWLTVLIIKKQETVRILGTSRRADYRAAAALRFGPVLLSTCSHMSELLFEA